MKLEKLHLLLYDSFGKREFGAKDLQDSAGCTYGSAKVTLNKLKKNRVAFPTGRGKYVLVSPENHVKLESLKNKKLFELAIESFKRAPKLSMLVLYGSQITGLADKHSDFDVLLVVPEKSVDEESLKKGLEEKIGAKVHLTVYSEKAFETMVVCEPYLKYWLNEGMIFDEKNLLKKAMKPVAKLGLVEFLETARNYIEVAKNETSLARKAKYYFTALKILLMIKNAIGWNYDYGLVKRHFMKTLGEKFVDKIRLGKKITSEETKAIEQFCLKEVSETENLASLVGENESDVFWKTKLKEEAK